MDRSGVVNGLLVETVNGTDDVTVNFYNAGGTGGTLLVENDGDGPALEVQQYSSDDAALYVENSNGNDGSTALEIFDGRVVYSSLYTETITAVGDMANVYIGAVVTVWDNTSGGLLTCDLTVPDINTTDATDGQILYLMTDPSSANDFSVTDGVNTITISAGESVMLLYYGGQWWIVN